MVRLREEGRDKTGVRGVRPWEGERGEARVWGWGQKGGVGRGQTGGVGAWSDWGSGGVVRPGERGAVRLGKRVGVRLGKEGVGSD